MKMIAGIFLILLAVGAGLRLIKTTIFAIIVHGGWFR